MVNLSRFGVLETQVTVLVLALVLTSLGFSLGLELHNLIPGPGLEKTSPESKSGVTTNDKLTNND